MSGYAFKPQAAFRGTQAIPDGHISIMASLKFTYCLTKGIMFFKNNSKTSLIIGVLFRVNFRLSNYETTVPTKRVTVSLIKVKSFTTLLRALMVYIGTHLNLNLRYNF
jgi:hypothetical protein